MILDEQLYRNYTELNKLIMWCYKDISILKAYEKIQIEKSESYNMVPHLSNHFVVLAQQDLALTLWKIYCDHHGKGNANTIPRFRNDINKLLIKSGSRYASAKKAMINKSTENKLNMLRRQYLAHIDMKRNNNAIKINELKNMLDEACRGYCD